MGVPGLIAAYKDATTDALNAAQVVECTENREITVDFPYLVMNQVMKVVKDMEPRVLEQGFDLSCRLRLSVRLRDAGVLSERLAGIESVNLSLS